MFDLGAHVLLGKKVSVKPCVGIFVKTGMEKVTKTFLKQVVAMTIYSGNYVTGFKENISRREKPCAHEWTLSLMWGQYVIQKCVGTTQCKRCLQKDRQTDEPYTAKYTFKGPYRWPWCRSWKLQYSPSWHSMHFPALWSLPLPCRLRQTKMITMPPETEDQNSC